MMQLMNELMDLLDLEKIEDNIFRGYSQDVGTNMLYGGQVFGQAISAAQATVTERKIHSAHAYFLRKGDHNLPVIYNVDRTHDGRSYSSRTITAIQHGQPIFTMMCSFQSEENSDISFADKIDVPSMDDPSIIEIDLEEETAEERSIRSKILNKQPFVIRFPEEDTEQPKPLEYYWLKANSKLPENSELNHSILAYASDFRLLSSTLRPIGYRYKLQEVMIATICHAIWFHRDFKLDEWLYTRCEPLSISNNRGIAKGSIYRMDGKLVASTMQEGVIRKLA
ncbi:MAG: acyl-CoA thioesterase domain-containing protein [Cellvibrionaceae bacterium]